MVAVLAAFAAHCDRMSLDRRPTIWVQFSDVWNQKAGEIGIPETPDIAHTAFALLSPWIIVPTIGEAWLVVDRLTYLSVTRLHVNLRGMFNPHWSVEYHMADDGTLTFAEPLAARPPVSVSQAVQGAKKARLRQTFWAEGHTFETVLPIVEGLLER